MSGPIKTDRAWRRGPGGSYADRMILWANESTQASRMEQPALLVFAEGACGAVHREEEEEG